VKASRRRKLKDDKFATAVNATVAKAKEHQNTIIIVAVLALGIGLAIAWLAISRQSAERTAEMLLVEANYAARIPPDIKGDKKQELINKVVARYEQIDADYPRTAAAPRALLKAGQLLSGAEKEKQAIAYFRRAIEAGGKYPGLALLAQRGLAETLEASGDVTAAIAEYDKLITDTPQAEQARINWDIGRCLETLNKEEEAKIRYQKAIEYGAGNTWAKLADFRLTTMTNQAASPPAPPTAPPEKKAPTTPAGEAPANQG